MTKIAAVKTITSCHFMCARRNECQPQNNSLVNTHYGQHPYNILVNCVTTGSVLGIRETYYIGFLQLRESNPTIKDDCSDCDSGSHDTNHES